MRITQRETEELRQLAASGESKTLETLSITEVDVYSAVELACSQYLRTPDHTALFSLLDRCESELPMLKTATQILLSGELPARFELFAPRSWEFFPIINARWYDNDYHLFESRFTAAAKQSGFGKVSTALAGAMYEMVDNITQHSGTSTESPARGLLGYHVEAGRMTFAVGDVGRGVLESLTENPTWKHLRESSDALEVVVKERASRRVGMGDGSGFLQVFKSLADMNGHLVFRSGNGLLTIKGESDKRRAVKRATTFLPGFQLSVCCSIR